MNDYQDGHYERQDSQDQLASVLEWLNLLVVLSDRIELLEFLLCQDAINFKLVLLSLKSALRSPSTPAPHVTCLIC